MDNPEFLPRIQESKERIQKTQELEDRGSVLRNEPGSRPAAVVGIGEPVRAELDLAAAEAEVRGVDEADNGIRIIELVTRAVDPEVIVVHEPFRMGQDHDADGERAEAELVGGENLTSATNGTSTMTDAELRRNDENVVVLLLVAELLEHACRLGRLPETLGTELAVAVVVELAVTGLLDHVEHLLHRLVVGRGDLLPLRDGEPSFGVRGKRTFDQLLVGVADAGEQLAQAVRLLGDALGLAVPREVAVLRRDLLVGELVGDRHLGEREDDRFADARGELGVAVYALSGLLAEGAVVLHRLLGGVGGDSCELLDLTFGCRFLGKRRHDVSPFHVLGTPRVGCPIDETSFVRPIMFSRRKLVSFQRSF